LKVEHKSAGILRQFVIAILLGFSLVTVPVVVFDLGVKFS